MRTNIFGKHLMFQFKLINLRQPGFYFLHSWPTWTELTLITMFIYNNIATEETIKMILIKRALESERIYILVNI
jgi:hypothetical protein